MYCPCLDGEQGMQGVVMTLTAENIKSFEGNLRDANVVDDEAGNEVKSSSLTLRKKNVPMGMILSVIRRKNQTEDMLLITKSGILQFEQKRSENG